MNPGQKGLFTIAVGAILAGSVAFGSPTPIEEVQEVADFMMQSAKCSDFNDALGKLKSGDQTPREALIMTLGIIYMEGYASGAGNDSGRRVDVVFRCFTHPDDRFNTVIPK